MKLKELNQEWWAKDIESYMKLHALILEAKSSGHFNTQRLEEILQSKRDKMVERYGKEAMKGL